MGEPPHALGGGQHLRHAAAERERERERERPRDLGVGRANRSLFARLHVLVFVKLIV